MVWIKLIVKGKMLDICDCGKGEKSERFWEVLNSCVVRCEGNVGFAVVLRDMNAWVGDSVVENVKSLNESE